MLSDEQIERHRAGQAALRADAKRQLVEWVNRGDITKSDPRVVRESLRLLLEHLASMYGDAAAAAAADFYDELRASAGVSGRYRAVLAAVGQPATVEKAAHWAVGPLFGAEPDQAAMLVRASTVLGRWVKTAATETINRSAVADPVGPRVVRVPRGDNTCAFCIMLASRGDLDGGYGSEWTAQYVSTRDRVALRRARRGSKRKPDEYHDDCDCEPVTIFPGDPKPPGWDHERYSYLYRSATDAAGTRGDTKLILATMREMHGLT